MGTGIVLRRARSELDFYPQISYADYNLLDTLQCYLSLTPTCLSALPLLSGYVERLLNRPTLSEYLKSEGRQRRLITPKHK